MLRVEPSNETRAFLCDSCGKLYGATRGFVYQDESAYALYYASMHNCDEGRDGRRVFLAIGIGEREDEEGIFGDARSVTFQVLPTETGVEISAVDVSESPWQQSRQLGFMMNRDEAIADTGFKEFLHAADHIVKEDAAISDYLNGDVRGLGSMGGV